MPGLVNSIMGYFSDDEQQKSKHNKAKRTKRYRKSRPVSAKKMTGVEVLHSRKSLARLSPKSRLYLMRKLGASPLPRNTVARTRKNLKALQKSMRSVTLHDDMSGFPQRALSEGYHYNNAAVQREVIEPNEELASGTRQASGYMSDDENPEEGPEIKRLSKEFRSVSTYSKVIKDGKQSEFGSFIVNDSDKPFIESGKLKDGKIMIKLQPRFT